MNGTLLVPVEAHVIANENVNVNGIARGIAPAIGNRTERTDMLTGTIDPIGRASDAHVMDLGACRG